jgi:hypothetical protein
LISLYAAFARTFRGKPRQTLLSGLFTIA